MRLLCLLLHTNNPVHSNNITEVKGRPGSVTENDKVLSFSKYYVGLR